MRIVGLDEFLLLPPGTVFAKYRPQIFGELCVKGDSIHEPSDFFYRPIWEPYAYSSGELHDVLVAAEERKAEVQIDTDCWQRDGLFEYDQLFAVFSGDEVAKIAESLVAAAKPPASAGSVASETVAWYGLRDDGDIAWIRYTPACGRPVTALYRSPTLTDAEREAVETAVYEAEAHQHFGRAATLRGLLERTK